MFLESAAKIFMAKQVRYGYPTKNRLMKTADNLPKSKNTNNDNMLNV
jgi:hypothetical protein